MERWTGTPEGTCNVLRMFRETHAISAIASSTTLDTRKDISKFADVLFARILLVELRLTGPTSIS